MRKSAPFMVVAILLGAIGCKSSPDGALAECRSELQLLGSSGEVFQVMYDRLPESLDEMTEEMDHGPVVSVIPNDPWDNPYRYAANRDGQTFRLSSMGPDGEHGTEDDLERQSP